MLYEHQVIGKAKYSFHKTKTRLPWIGQLTLGARPQCLRKAFGADACPSATWQTAEMLAAVRALACTCFTPVRKSARWAQTSINREILNEIH